METQKKMVPFNKSLSKEEEDEWDRITTLLNETAQNRDHIGRGDLSMLKSMVAPSVFIIDCLQFVCFLTDPNLFTEYMPGGKNKYKHEGGWDYAKRFIVKTSFMKDIQSFKWEDINPKNYEKAKKYYEETSNLHDEKKVFSASNACGNLLKWALSLLEAYEFNMKLNKDGEDFKILE